MTLFQTVILVSALGNMALGIFVLASNSRRRANMVFFWLTIVTLLWLVSMGLSTIQQSYSGLLFFVRATSALATGIPIGVFMLHLAIIKPDAPFRDIIHQLRYWLLAFGGLTVLCFFPLFIHESSFSTPAQSVPVSQYGIGIVPYLFYFAAATAAIAQAFWRSRNASTGAQQAETHFLQLGCLLSFSVGLALFGASILFDNQEISRLVPLSVLIWDGVVAYGIATKRILSVSQVMQRVVAYGLMVAALTGVYILTYRGVGLLFRGVVADPSFIAHLLAALVAAFLVTPLQHWMHMLSRRLILSKSYSGDEILAGARAMIREISTESNLIANFAQMVRDAFGAVEALLLLPAPPSGEWRQVYPPASESASAPVRLSSDGPLLQLLTAERSAVTTDMLARMRPVSPVPEARQALEDAHATLAVACSTRDEMKAILLLGQRKSGRIYDLRDQRALHLLFDQFGVALENASLYTTVQNGKIYNDILLDSITSGIIAVGSDRRITVFNQRAQELTGLPESEAIGAPLKVLPEAFARALGGILDSRQGFRDMDMTIRRNEESIPVRVSGSVFHSHIGDPLGALLVFADMSLLRRMEEQIRRTDRLSSLGTLSAGMAHEIKNPLVTIKTFTQLLPDKYTEPEFRGTFFELVGQEVGRIDAIVNRLLNFARPAPPVLSPIRLHEVLDNSLRLAEPQLAKAGIKLKRRLHAGSDHINADAEQLNQVFINLFLNAIQAMGPGDVLTVRTSIVHPAPDVPWINGQLLHDCIQVDVQDTGCGIAPDVLARIFDPFFTTKEQGAGLGLSVCHGIVYEHGGVIDVKSEPGRGTVFHVQVPLMDATPEDAP